MVDDDETPWWMQAPEGDEPGSSPEPEPDAATEVAAPPLRAPAAPHMYLPKPAAPPIPDPAPEGLEHPGLRPRPVDHEESGPAPTEVTPPVDAETVADAPGPAGAVLPEARAEAPADVRPDAPTDDTEVAPPPRRLPRSNVRRVAVVPDPPPPPPARESDPMDRTEKLPQVPDEIFATFSADSPGPDPEEPGAVATRTRTRQRTAGTPGRGLRLPEALSGVDRQTGMFGAAGLVLVVLLVVLLSKVGLFGGGDPDPEASATSTPRTQAVGDFSNRPDGLSKVSDGQAESLLARVKQSGSGSVVEAWTWNDKNGKNLIATLREPAAGGHVTLKVVHAAQLDGSGKTLRTMTDPGLPRGCSGTAEFTPKSLQVADLDGDGIAEVAAGWSSQCSGQASSEVRLALITNGEKYIVRGSGVVGKDGSAKTDPASSDWPRGYVSALGKLFGSLYYKP